MEVISIPREKSIFQGHLHITALSQFHSRYFFISNGPRDWHPVFPIAFYRLLSRSYLCIPPPGRLIRCPAPASPCRRRGRPSNKHHQHTRTQTLPVPHVQNQGHISFNTDRAQRAHAPAGLSVNFPSPHPASPVLQLGHQRSPRRCIVDGRRGLMKEQRHGPPREQTACRCNLEGVKNTPAGQKKNKNCWIRHPWLALTPSKPDWGPTVDLARSKVRGRQGSKKKLASPRQNRGPNRPVSTTPEQHAGGHRERDGTGFPKFPEKGGLAAAPQTPSWRE